MNKKLTLTIEQSIIEKAKHYAHEKGKSLSSMIENYLKALIDKKSGNTELGPIVSELKGSFKTDEEIDYKKVRIERLSEKYLK